MTHNLEMEVHPTAPTQDNIAENNNNRTPLKASPVRLVLPGKAARIPLCLLHPPDTTVCTPVRSTIRPVITGHVPDNQSQDGPVNVSCDLTGLTGERCADQLASPTILGRCLHDENRYMMIAFAIHLHHFPNQLLLHCNRLHVVPIYIKRSSTNTKGSQQTSGCNITSHIEEYLSTNSSPNRAKSTMQEEQAISYGLSPSKRKVSSHRLRILHSSL